MFREKFDRKFAFESYGVKVAVESNRDDVLAKAESVVRKALLDRIKIIDNTNAVSEFVFGIGLDEKGIYYLFQGGQQTNNSDSEFIFFKFFDSMIRLTVAEHAVSTVFLHSGAVGWQGKAIIFPARSFKGKTTLVAEMLRNGAEYYSDEYAILDETGLVHPFPRDLTMRGIEHEYADTEVPISSLDCKIGVAAIPVGVVLITEYVHGAEWSPKILSSGQGIIEVIPHTIPLHADTQFSLKVLNIALGRAIIAKSIRGDAKLASKQILAFVDKHLN